MALTTAQVVEIISAAGDLIKLLSKGYEDLNTELMALEIADDLTDSKLEELKQIVADNALLTDGPTITVGEVVTDNPTPVADGVIKAIDEMPIELPADGVVATAVDETVDTTEPTTSETVNDAIAELVEAIKAEGIEEAPAATQEPVSEVPVSEGEPVADPSNPTTESNLFR